MRKLLFITLALCSTLMLRAAKTDKDVTIKVNGENRSYRLYVPSTMKDNCPLVLSLHGAGGQSSNKSPFRTDVADKAGCIVAYPQGKLTAFPGLGGMQANGWSAYGEENFDTDFLKAVIEDVASKYAIDRQRLYCCGFSNGGMMTYVMANTCSHLFAAFAAISGYPINEFHLHHTSWRPVPFLHIHGKNDDFVKYSLVPNIIDNMVARNGANPVPKKTAKSGKYTKSVYEAGEGGFPIIFYEIEGMGHEDYTGNTEDNSSAQTMWNFFKQYTLDSPCDTTLKWRPRIETEGYTPKSHGWTVNSGKTLLAFGQGTKTDANQNVYRTLQLKKGRYKLCFKSEGEDGKTLGVKLQCLKPSKSVLNTTVNVGGETTLYFTIDNTAWGEYKITFTRDDSSEAITITDIALYTATEGEEATSTLSPTLSPTPSTTSPKPSPAYDLNGRRLASTAGAKPGLYISEGKKLLLK